MPIVARVAGPLLLLGAVASLAVIPFILNSRVYGSEELLWLALGATFLVSATYVRHRMPRDPIAAWFAIIGGGFVLIQALDGLMALVLAAGGTSALLAWLALGYHLGAVALVIGVAHVLGLFPDGEATRLERRALRLLWPLFAVPPLAFLTGPTITLPAYHDPPAIPNPYHLALVAPLDGVAQVGIGVLPIGFILGVLLLVRRYRRGLADRRRRIRWLLVPALLAGFAAVLESFRLLTPVDVGELVTIAVWIASLMTLPIAIAIALLRPDLLDVDRVLRKSLVYGSLWTLIALTYVVAAVGLGIVAGRRLDVGAAIVLTVVATLVFQPARRRLEHLADRWVFGARVDPAHLITQLGTALAGTFDLDTLLPHISTTLRQGLGLAWVRVRLDGDLGPAPEALAGRSPDPDEDPVLVVPIVLGSESLGQVQCGPRTNGTELSDPERDLVTTLARQAALAVRNVKLTAELSERLVEVRDQATELERSRVRLVRAQELERRRIERNIHDGVQQDLVALLSQLGRLRQQFAHDPHAATATLEQFQASLQRVLVELRELGHGIHPTLLTDRGLLEAVEALAARSSLPVVVRADPSLRGHRFSQEVEGAGYFTVAEALANVLKHAGADRAEVTLQRTNGSLSIEVTDDGTGFDDTSTSGNGLVNLAERLSALGGHLEVSSSETGTTVRAVLTATEPSATGG